MRIFCRPPVAISASLAATSLPLTKADIAIRLETPRMIPSIVRSERNLCAQISLKPMLMALLKFTSSNLRRHVSLQAGQFRIDLRGDFPIPDFNPARRDRGDTRVVSDQGDGPALLAELAEQV